MPRYVYRCANGHEREETRAVEDRDSPLGCSECAQEKRADATGTLYRQPLMHRVLTFAAFRI